MTTIVTARADKFNTVTSSSARGLAMGDAVINSERGGSSVFYNPANIAAKNTGVTLNLFNLQLEYSEMAVAARSFSALSLSSLYKNQLTKRPNSFMAQRISLYPSFTIRNLSVGLLYEINEGAELQSGTNSIRVKARDRFAPTAALSFRLFSGIFRIGASVQLLTVGNADTIIANGFDPAGLNYKTVIDAGTGLSKTGAITLSLPIRYLPSFSLVARDIGGTSFTKTPAVKFGDGRSVAAQPLTFDFATSIIIYLGKYIEWKTEGDYRDVINKKNGSFMRHFSLGTEFSLANFIFLRGGYAHGYLSGGLALGTKKASIELSMYSDEFDDRLRSRPDNRFLLQYRWGFAQ